MTKLEDLTVETNPATGDLVLVSVGVGYDSRKVAISDLLKLVDHGTDVILYGENLIPAATSVTLSSAGGDMVAGQAGVPVVQESQFIDVAVSMQHESRSAPSDWTLTLWKRSPGGAYASAATLAVDME